VKRSQLPPHKTATYVLPRWNVVYVSVPKAACTSLKWLAADLQGESAEHFYGALSRETGRSMTVHHRSRWQHTPMLHEMSDAGLEEISPDNGWFVFGVVRHPTARLWSGWQSKFLLQEPRFRDLYPEAPWPRVPDSTREVVEDFLAFVRTLEDEPGQRIFRDRHFLPQTELLGVDRMPYSRVYRTSEMPALLTDLEKHARQYGLEQMPDLLRSNETPLRPLASMFPPDIQDIIQAHYSSDFEHFGYGDTVPDAVEPGDNYPSAALAEIGRMVERAERISDLYHMATELRDKQRSTAKRLTAARARQRAAAKKPAVVTLGQRRGAVPTCSGVDRLLREAKRRMVAGLRRE
jgi:hypothetical protein